MYHVYVYSHLGYGLMAARAAVLGKVSGDRNPCVPAGHKGEYTYGGKTHAVVGHPTEPAEVRLPALRAHPLQAGLLAPLWLSCTAKARGCSTGMIDRPAATSAMTRAAQVRRNPPQIHPARERACPDAPDRLLIAPLALHR